MYLAILGNSIFVLCLAGLAVVVLLDYFLFDALVDKISWRLVWSKYYNEKHFERNDEHIALKKYESNPTEANRIALEKYFHSKT